MKYKKTVLLFMLILIITMSLGTFSGCSEKADKYTEEEHIQRVKERIEERFINKEYGGVTLTSCSVYPLYDENDKLRYFVVDFEPCGFVYVLLRNEQLKAFSFLGASTSMYKLSFLEFSWSPYTIDETNSQPEPDKNKIWKLDENGEKIVYKRSPHKIAGIENQKRYLIQTGSEPDADARHKTSNYITAVKTENGFLNLISNTEFDISDGLLENMHATQYIVFIAKKDFDL